jgi:hypothetical protein
MSVVPAETIGLTLFFIVLPGFQNQDWKILPGTGDYAYNPSYMEAEIRRLLFEASLG